MSHIIDAYLKEPTEVTWAYGSLDQWDVGQILQIHGATKVASVLEVHFWTENTYDKAVKSIGTQLTDGTIVCYIPDQNLQKAGNLIAYVYCSTIENEGEDDEYTASQTEYKVVIPVAGRPQPGDYMVPTGIDMFQRVLAEMGSILDDARDAEEAAAASAAAAALSAEASEQSRQAALLAQQAAETAQGLAENAQAASESAASASAGSASQSASSASKAATSEANAKSYMETTYGYMQEYKPTIEAAIQAMENTIDTYKTQKDAQIDQALSDLNNYVDEHLGLIKLQTVLSASNWSSTSPPYYSFESAYPKATYDLEVEIDGDRVTESQLSYWNASKPTGSYSNNRIIALGDKPTVDLPVIVRVRKV